MNRKIEVRNSPIEEISPQAQSARTHSAQQVDQVTRSSLRSGFINPTLFDMKSILDGPHRMIPVTEDLVARLKRDDM